MRQLLIFNVLCCTLWFQTIMASDQSTVTLVLIAPHEAEEELEGDPSTRLQVALDAFREKGGTLVRLDHEATPFQLAPGDIVFPSCSAGFNRSQTLWNVLRPYADKIKLMPPHATRYGFDPYNDNANWIRGNHGPRYDEFAVWAGVPKAQRFGWDVFAEWLSEKGASPDELARMKEFYNKRYFGSELSEGSRRIYITFARNAHIHLYRLSQANESLEGVIVLFFPLDDLIKSPLPEWETYPQSTVSYTQLAKILRSRLDFTQLVERQKD